MYDVCAGPSRLIVAATDPRRRVAMASSSNKEYVAFDSMGKVTSI